METLRQHAQKIIDCNIEQNLPHKAVQNALEKHEFCGNIYIVAIGKAGWSMAKAASDYLGDRISKGIVITKYEHSQGDLPNIEVFESGHPVSDENTVIATQKAIDLAKSLTEKDELLFLISGGGSALFEKPLDGISLADIQDITNQLLASGADIVEMNMIRKRFSSVKAGRFAKIAEPAKVFTIVLSDVLGDRLDSIASGPASPDNSTYEDAQKVVHKYDLNLTENMKKYLEQETPKSLGNVETVITGSVRTLCNSAADVAKDLGYTPYILSSTMNCEAREAGRLMATMAQEVDKSNMSFKSPCALIMGGETVVTLKGNGKGGRNQEIALGAAEGISGMDNVLVFSLGSDGTDGPTDAAGGIVDGSTLLSLKEKEIDIHQVLSNNDAYNALKAVDGLIITGPTGTNVNDVSVVLVGQK